MRVIQPAVNPVKWSIKDMCEGCYAYLEIDATDLTVEPDHDEEFCFDGYMAYANCPECGSRVHVGIYVPMNVKRWVLANTKAETR